MGNMYNFVETFNPLGGECSHKCSYCYRKDMMRFPVNKEKYSGKPRLIYGKSGMDKNLGNGNFWFVGSMTDIFAKDVPDEMIIKILEYCNKFPSNKYLFQSKNPKRFEEFTIYFPENTTLCTTIETNRTYCFRPQARHLPTTMERAWTIHKTMGTFDIHITIEPIMDFDLDEMVTLMQIISPKQINIGADSSRIKKLPEPPKEKILELISELEKFTTVHQKPNLGRLLK